ncbi:MAG: hypothetical protein GWN62_24225 [Aliifodinibius sp.]|nr:hypothetical protein [Fodinibius sp.]
MEWQFGISIIIWFLLIGFFKALRDIIDNRFKWSIFDSDKLPKWLRDYLTDSNPNAPSAVDGWHQSDGIIVLLPMAMLMYWGNRLVFQISWWWAILAFVIISVVFYVVWFNGLYHYILMKDEYKGQSLSPDREDVLTSSEKNKKVN